MIGEDADPSRATLLANGTSPVEDVPTEVLAPLVQEGRLAVHSSTDALSEADAIVICVPTPLGKSKEPDISFIVAAADGVVSFAGSVQNGLSRLILYSTFSRASPVAVSSLAFSLLIFFLR